MSFFNKPPQEPSKSIFGAPLNAQPTQNTSNPLNPTAQPSTTSTTNPSIFGTVKPGTGIFGNTASTSSGGSLFGNTGTTTSSSMPAPGGGLFGSGGSTSSNTGANITSSSMSAPTSMTPAGGSLFGGSVATSTTTPGTTPSLFGNAQKPAEISTTGSLFGSGSTTGATPATNSLFGTTGGGSATPAGGSLFGRGTGSNPLAPGKSTDSNIPKPSPSAVPTSATTTSTTGPSTSIFGLPPKPVEGTSAATPGSTTQSAAGAAGGTLFGGGSLFGKTPAATTSTTPASTSTTGAAPSGSPSLFGTKPEEKKDGATATATTTPGFSLFGAPKGDAPATSAVTPAAAMGPGIKPAATAAPVASVAVLPPSMLRGKTLEEIVNRWSADLETHAREFNRFAAEVAVWDRALIENGNNLTAIYSHITAAERQQDSIDQSLTHIEQQQKDLSATLDSYEKMSQELLGGQGGSLRTLDTGPADTERDKNYILATDLHTQLDDLSGSLTQMIDAVNVLSVSSKPNGELNDDPMTQIFQILSSHLESLQWIDGAVREVENRIGDIERRVKDSGYNLSGSTNQPKSRGFGLGR